MEISSGAGQGESKLEVMISSGLALPDGRPQGLSEVVMVERVWSRSAWASGSSSSVLAEVGFFSNRISELTLQNSSSAVSDWFSRG